MTVFVVVGYILFQFLFPARTSAFMYQELELLKQRRDQLYLESEVEPLPLSRTLDELVTYIQTNLPSDRLVTGFETPKDNPFMACRDSCVVS